MVVKIYVSANVSLSEQKYWTYNDQGYVSFKDVSLPANLLPESIMKVITTHDTQIDMQISSMYQ